MRFNRQSLALAAAVSAALLSSGKLAHATPLDPNAFTSLGTLNVSSGSITINTTTGQITGAASFTGTFFSQGGGNPQVAVFDFSGFNIGAGVTVNVVGDKPLALLSRNTMTIAPTLTLNGGAGALATGGTAGVAGGFAGGDAGFSNNAGHGPGGGSGFGNPHDGGGGGFGGAGGLGDQQTIAGTSYGDLNSYLTGGSGGAGGAGSALDGGGGGGGGAIELGSVGFMSLGGVFANGGTGGGDEDTFDGGGGAGGGVLIHSNGLGVGGIGAFGGAGAPYGGGGGGGRFTLVGSLFSGTGANANLAALASVVSGGNSNFASAGIAGVASLRPGEIDVGSGESVNVGITPGQTGRTDARTEMLPDNLTIATGGASTIISPLSWKSGGAVTVQGGNFNVNNDTTFTTGSTLNWTSGALAIASGKTLTFDGGTGTVTAGGKGLANGATLKVTNNGKFTSNEYFDIGSSADAGNGPVGTLLVSAGGSYQQTGGLNPFWGYQSADYANVTFTGANSVGSLNSGLAIAVSGGSADVNINSGARLQVDNGLSVGTFPPAATPNGIASGRQINSNNNQAAGSIGGYANITIDSGGTLTSTGASNFGVGANVNLINGGLNLSNATFSPGSTLHWSGGVLGANSKITFDGGAGSVTTARGLPNGATLAIINGGVFTTTDYLDIGSSIDAGNGPTGTLLVSGPGSRVDIHSGTSSAWGGYNGDSATVTFSSGGAGTIDNLDVAFAGGRSLVTIGGGSTLTVNNYLSVGGAATSAGTVNVAGGALSTSHSSLGTGGVINYSAGSFSAGTITMTGNAKITLTAGNDKVLRATGLDMSGTSKIDLADNDMIVGSLSTSRSTIEGFVRTARNGGAWNGTLGITSSTAQANVKHSTTLGVMSGADFHAVQSLGALFDGQTVSNSDILVRYTYYGDANFNGKVDGGDYARIDTTFINEHTAGNIGGWINGDWDYNGKVDGGDYGLIDAAFNNQTGTLARALAILDGSEPNPSDMQNEPLALVVEHLGEFGQPYADAFVSAVPEPASVLSVLAVGMLLRRNRRR